jgi:hypothetical protein
MPKANPNLENWLVAQIADPGNRGPVSRIELYHTVEESPAERIQVFEVEEGIDVADLAQSIWDMAENDAGTRALGMPQRYVIWSYRGESSEMDSQFAFALRGKAITRSNMEMGDASDPSTERGHVGQMMRHNESLHRMMMLMNDATNGRLIAELQAERQLRSEIEGRWMEAIKLTQELLDRKSERELFEARELAKSRRHDELMGLFTSMLPVMASQFLGQKGFGSSATATMRDAGIGKILKNLSEEEAMGILNSLKGQNQLAFMELYKSYAAQDAAEEAKKPIPFRQASVDKKK